MLKTLTLAGIAALVAVPVLAEITIQDAYARASGPSAKSGAAFMTIVNDGDSADRLLGASAEIADVAELHTHIEDANGVMKMREIEGGIAVPANGSHVLMRGGDHVMLMGLTAPMNDGDTVPITLTFETAGEIRVDVPVDLDRKPMAHGAMGGEHSN